MKSISFLCAALWAINSHTSPLAAKAHRAEPIDAYTIVGNIPVALLVDADSGQTLFAREPDARFMPASVTKVMTLYHAFELADQGKISLSQVIKMGVASHKEWYHKGSTMFIAKEQYVPIDLLLLGIAAVSANDGSIALAEGVAGSIAGWTRGMNASAARLGMRNSHFNLPNGWKDGGKTFTSARDLTILGRAMVADYPDYYARYIGRPGLTFNGYTQRNHDPITGVVTGADGIKTGFTDEAGYTFLGSAKRGNMRLMMVLAGADFAQERDRAARKLIDWGFSAFDQPVYFTKNSLVAKARMATSEDGVVELVTGTDVHVFVAHGARPKLRFKTRIDDAISPPFKAGQKLGVIETQLPSGEVLSWPLVVKTPVKKAGVFQTIANYVKTIFV